MNKYLFFIITFLTFTSCSNNETINNENSNYTPAENISAPQAITFTIDSIYPHDPKAFTQGLEFYKGKLYEGTGLHEETNLRMVNIKTGKIEKNHHISDTSIFGEGITIFKDKIYQLTWTNHKVFVYDVNNINEPINILHWSSEGWGLTHDSSSLIVSDGITSNIYFVSPENFRTLKTISVSDNNGPVYKLNELEFVQGYLYANQWQTDNILKIDLSNGHVVGKITLSGLLAQYASKEIKDDTDVLNGIAYNSNNNEFYVTGKNWPKLFAIHLNN